VPTLWPGQRTDLTTVVETVKRLKRCADRMGRSFVIEIRGYTEPTDDAQTDQKTSELLATRFLENLKTQGLDAALFVTKGMGSAASGAKPPAAKDPARNYHVCLKVVDADR
jgi:outer membrane protein OmpA-like peptidoglycan-associated protein